MPNGPLAVDVESPAADAVTILTPSSTRSHVNGLHEAKRLADKIIEDAERNPDSEPKEILRRVMRSDLQLQSIAIAESGILSHSTHSSLANSLSPSFREQPSKSPMDPFISQLAYRCVKSPDTSVDSVDFERWSSPLASILFVDMSNYSKITAALASSGAHALSEAVNAYLSSILDIIVNRFGGDAITFAGDAVMAMWAPGDDLIGTSEEQGGQASARTALKCAMQLQELCGHHPVAGTNMEFRLHISMATGIVVGRVFSSTGLRSMQPAYQFVSGEPLQKAGALVDVAKSGEVVISAEAEALANAGSTFVHVEKVNGLDAHRVICLADVSDSLDEDSSASSFLEAMVNRPKNSQKLFIHPSIVRRLNSGMRAAEMAEMRHLTVLFIRKVDDSMLTSDWFQEVQQQLDRHQCPVVQILDDDKGIHIVAAVNLFVAEPNGCEVAVKAMNALREREISCMVGCAAGVVFCGVMGSLAACRWDISGAACVRACRLMQYAHSSGVPYAVDDSVLRQLRDRSMLTEAGTTPIKGTTEPVTVWTLAQDVNGTTSRIVSPQPFARIHAEHYQRLRTFVARSSDRRPAAVISGPVGTGKLTLARRSIIGTRYTAIIHICDRQEAPVSVLRTLGEWFLHHEDAELVAISKKIISAANMGFATKTFKLAVELVKRTLSLGLNTVVIIKYAQHLDTISTSFVQQIRAGDVLDGSSQNRGRWAVLLTHVPCYGITSAAKLSDRLASPGMAVPLIEISTTATAEIKLVVEANSRVWQASTSFFIANHQRAKGFMSFTSAVDHFLTEKYYDRSSKGLAPLAAVDQSGAAYTTAEGARELSRTKWTAIAPTEVTKLLAGFDTLPPTYQTLLKVMAAISLQNSDIYWPLTLLGDVRRVVVGQAADVHSTREAVKVLEELRVLQVLDGQHVKFFNPVYVEVLTELLTPKQCRKINKTAAEIFESSPHVRESPLLMMFVARFYFFAGLMEEFRAEMNAAWKLLVRLRPEKELEGGLAGGSVAKDATHVASAVASGDTAALVEIYEKEAAIRERSSITGEWKPHTLEDAMARFLDTHRINGVEVYGVEQPDNTHPHLAKYHSLMVSGASEPIAHEVMLCKEALPRLSLGPMCDAVLDIGMCAVKEHLACVRRDKDRKAGKAMVPETSDMSAFHRAVAYMRCVRDFEAAVPPAEGQAPTKEEEFAGEEARVMRFVSSSLNAKTSLKTISDFLIYFKTTVKSREERVTKHCSSMSTLPDALVASKTDPRSRAIVRAFNMMNDEQHSVDLAAAFHNSLMALATGNFHPGGQTNRVTLEYIREQFFKHPTSTAADYKAFLYSFLTVGDSSSEEQGSNDDVEQSPQLPPGEAKFDNSSFALPPSAKQ